jgi:ATP-dependent Lhr-like helicase
MVELIRSRMDVCGPATQDEIHLWLRAADDDVAALHNCDAALLALENEGRLLRGHFTPGEATLEWCDRRLLARIHRYTLDRLRAEIEPVSARDFMRFLFRWQRVEHEHRAHGLEGLAAVVDQCAGFESAAAAWETDILPLRVHAYDASLLDALCLSGRVAWGRLGLHDNRTAAPVRATPVALCPRDQFGCWATSLVGTHALSTDACAVRDALTRRGASFFHEIVSATALHADAVELALAELVAAGVATADSFAGLRALLAPKRTRKSRSAAASSRRRRVSTMTHSVANAGRWSLLLHAYADRNEDGVIEQRARALLRRYGVVFRRLLAREAGAPSWRELVLVYRRLEARGEIRGGRFVTGVSGEQFALPEAIGLLRSVRREPLGRTHVVISAADPLNLVGIIKPEQQRVPAAQRNRILFRDGAPIAALEGGELRSFAEHAGVPDDELRRLLKRGTLASPPRTHRRTDSARAPRPRALAS